MLFYFAPASINETTDIGHGRIGSRKCSVANNLKFMDVSGEWEGLKSIVRIETERFTKENNLHWVLDEVFGEYRSRRRKGNSAENFNIVAKIAMALIKKSKPEKYNISQTRVMAGWKNDFRDRLIHFK